MSRAGTSNLNGPRQIEGKPVENATKPVLLAIRTSDIKYAVSTAPDACAAALAICRQLPDVQSARVFAGRTFIEYESKWVRYHTSRGLREEIVALDGGGKFKPGIYRLAAVTPTASRPGSHGSQTNKTTPKHTHKKRRKPVHVHTVRGHIHFGATVPKPQLAALSAHLMQEKK